MRIKLATPLLGEFPRYANVKLPDNAAVTAQNMRLDSGVLKLEAWETQELREAGVTPLAWDRDLRSYETNLDLQAANPVDYAYKLLEASGEFPEATWNV